MTKKNFNQEEDNLMHNTSKINLILWSSDVDQMPSDIQQYI